MSVFASTFNQVLFLSLCILCGIVIKKLKLIPENADVTLSKIESFIFIPCMTINSFYNNCTKEALASNANLLLYSLVYLGAAVVLAYPIAKILCDSKSAEGIYRYSLVVPSYGFMGNALVQSLLGENALFRYLLFTAPLTLFVFSVGMLWIVGSQGKFSVKRILNPSFVSVVAGVVMGLLHPPLPDCVALTLRSLGGCFSPMAMLITGVVIGSFDMRQLLGNWRVYMVTLLRLVLIPLLFLFVSKLLSVPGDIILLMMFSVTAPLGLNTIIFPAAYGGDKTLGASMAIISNAAVLVTIPLLISMVL